ncbi:MAG: bifunctional glutamate N-acetyltransferase/amino-acid acetyltransferase ArgJ [Syntrophomonadaceae bacterium]|jgi:glutamate N-acetyltransferase/amino-acid N-acetyltransferase|nr:bifunctional glutamate N-acetyltransferase/amino-acid acetyltransferase ArgJ [Syntrophomonadaceae bacterium]
MKLLDGSVTAPLGFLAQGVNAEIKSKNKKDVGIIYSICPATAAGVFTQNKVRAACVDISQEHLRNNQAQAIVVNSGNANACTGSRGWNDALKTAAITAEALDIQKNDVLIASTGVIGGFLPMDRMEKGIRSAAAELSQAGAVNLANAIMTTDLRSKEIAVEFDIQGHSVRMGATAKGSGMIHPNMATMLGFITTDALISASCLQAALKASVDVSYNMVSIDRDTSTNDAVMILANGKAGNPVIDDVNSGDMKKFQEALDYINIAMSKMIARDGEGATHLLEIKAENAADIQTARMIARSVASSNLVKTAIFGNDANWGRVLCAAGYSGADFLPDKVDVFIGDIQVAKDGCIFDFSEEEVKPFLESETVLIKIDLKSGDKNALAWGCDLTYDYIKINADYRT